MSRRRSFWQSIHVPTALHNGVRQGIKRNNRYTKFLPVEGESIADSWTATKAERAFRKTQGKSQRES